MNNTAPLAGLISRYGAEGFFISPALADGGKLSAYLLLFARERCNAERGLFFGITT